MEHNNETDVDVLEHTFGSFLTYFLINRYTNDKLIVWFSKPGGIKIIYIYDKKI